MSAVPVPTDNKRLTGIRGNFAKIPPSFIDPRGATRGFTHAETVMFLVLANELSWTPRGVGMIGLSWRDLSKKSAFVARTCQDAASILEAERGIIESRPFEGGRKYSIKRIPVVRDGDSTKQAHCEVCNEIVPHGVDVEWLPIPKTFFDYCLPALEHGELLIVMYFLRETDSWSKPDRQISMGSLRISVEHLGEVIDRKPSEVEKDLASLKKKGVAACDEGKGKVKTWWLCPENWSSLEPRKKRAGGNPEPVKRGAKVQEIKSEEHEPIQKAKPVEPKVTTSPLEFINSLTGTCFKCHRWGVIKPVSEAQQAARKPIVGTRAAPSEKIRSDIPEWKGFKKA